MDSNALLDALLKFKAWQETDQPAELDRLRAENERLLAENERLCNELLKSAQIRYVTPGEITRTAFEPYDDDTPDDEP